MFGWFKKCTYLNVLYTLDTVLIKAIMMSSKVNGHDARTFEAMREDVQTIIRATMGNGNA